MLRAKILATIVFFLFSSFPYLFTSAQITQEPNAIAPHAEFLNSHNFYRQQYNLPPLQWDTTLASFASNYANERSNDCQMINSTSLYGENLFWGGKDVWTPSQVVKSWVDEKNFYDFNRLECMPNQMCGHFTQVVWRNTLRVGCGSVKCKNGDGRFFVCAYDPPGNFIDESPFGGLKNVVVNVSHAAAQI